MLSDLCNIQISQKCTYTAFCILQYNLFCALDSCKEAFGNLLTFINILYQNSKQFEFTAILFLINELQHTQQKPSNWSKQSLCATLLLNIGVIIPSFSFIFPHPNFSTKWWIARVPEILQGLLGRGNQKRTSV